jgi:hypothetical protein
MSRSAKARCVRVASALVLVVGIVLVVMSTVAFAQDDPGGGSVSQADVATQNVPLHNDTATSVDCPDPRGDTSIAYWHFVIAPNAGYAFVTITLNVGGTTYVFSGSDIIENSGPDNVFVAVPSGHVLTDLMTSGSSADITPDSPPPNNFNLSGICAASETTTSSTTTSSTTTSTSTSTTSSTTTSTSTSTTSTSTTSTSTTTTTEVPTTTTTTEVPTSTTEAATTTSGVTPTSEVSPTSVVASSTTTTKVAGEVVTLPPATPGGLAFTGSNDYVIPMAVLGALMIIAGLGLAFYAQRRFA